MASSLTVPFRPSDISTGLVGYWKFNNDATDSSGKGYDLTAVNSPTYAVDDRWKSGEYSTDLVPASNHRFTRARNADLDLLNAFTICVWVNADDITSVQIIDKDQAGNGYGIYLDASSKAILNINNGARATSATALSIGKWTHLAFVYNQTSASIYINGNLDISSAYSTDAADEAVDLTIGALGDGTLDWDGHLKDLAIWSSALTPIQIKSLAMGVDLSKYAYRPNNVSTQPTHWWKLNELSGNRADSVSTNPLTLTDNNTVLASGGYVEGTSAKFVGASNEFLSCSDSADFNLADGNFSVRIRFKLDTAVVNGDWNTFFSQYDDVNNNYKFCLYASGGVDYITLLIPSIFDSSTSWAMPSKFVVGVWYDVIFRRNGTSWTAWCDGIQIGSTITSSATMPNYSSDVQFGMTYSTYYNIEGSMEDFAIWKGYALTDAEIKSLACGMPIQQAGIVSYWKLNEESGNRADSIGTNTLTDNNSVLYGTGKVGNAADLESTNSEYLSKSSPTGMDIETGGEITLLTWIKKESVISAQEMSLMSRGGVSPGSNTGAWLWYWYTDLLRFRTYNQISWTCTLPNAEWHQVAVTRHTYSTTGWSAYKDGESLGVGSGTIDLNIDGNSKPFGIGAATLDGTPDRFWDGLADESIFAKRYFLPEEVKAVYLKGLNGKEATSSEVTPATTQAQIIWIT